MIEEINIKSLSFKECFEKIWASFVLCCSSSVAFLLSLLIIAILWAIGGFPAITGLFSTVTYTIANSLKLFLFWTFVGIYLLNLSVAIWIFTWRQSKSLLKHFSLFLSFIPFFGQLIFITGFLIYFTILKSNHNENKEKKLYEKEMKEINELLINNHINHDIRVDKETKHYEDFKDEFLKNKFLAIKSECASEYIKQHGPNSIDI